MKILVDTDIGSDIDDALCLSYLFNRPDAEVVGISTVSGKPLRRAKLASAVARFYSKEVPICVGTADPLSGEQRQPEVPQAEILDDWPHDTVFVDRPVERFLAHHISSSPGEVVLLALGPLTNIARLVQCYPDALPELSRLVSMSGRFSDTSGMANVPEWNLLCDLDAARIVYGAAQGVDTLLVSSDVTRQLSVGAQDAAPLLSERRLGPVGSMSRVWFATREKMTIHDGLAAALLFEPNLCSLKPGVPVVEWATGVSSWQDDARSRINATCTVDTQAFLNHFFGVIPTEQASGETDPEPEGEA